MVASVFFALLAVHASEIGYTGKTIDPKRLAPDSLTYPVPTTRPICLSWAMFHCQDVTNHCTLVGDTDYPLFVCHDQSTLQLPGSQHGKGSLGFRWSWAENFGVHSPGANCPSIRVDSVSPPQ